MVKPVDPCRDCDNRKIGCHTGCDLRDKFVERLQNYNDLIKSNRAKDCDFTAYRRGKHERLERWTR